MKLRDSSKNSNVLSLYPSIDKTSQHSIENSTIRSKDNQSMQLPSAVEPSSSDIKLPPDMKSRGSSSSPVDTRVEAIPGIRYPSSWRQHRSISPQRASKKISEDSSESFHSAESHGPDYNILSSINPPKTKIMVSLTYQICGLLLYSHVILKLSILKVMIGICHEVVVVLSHTKCMAIVLSRVGERVSNCPIAW